MRFIGLRNISLFIFLLFSTVLFGQDKVRLHTALAKLATPNLPDTQRVTYLDNVGWDTSYDNLALGLKYCLEALDLAEQIKYERGIIHVCNSIGTIYQDMGDANKAISFQLRGLALAEKTNNKTAQATANMNISIVYLSQNDPVKALQHLLKSKQIFSELNNQHGLAGLYGNLGAVYLNFPDSTDKAVEAFTKGIEIATAIHEPENVAHSLGGLGKAKQKLGDTITADKYMTRALAIFDSLKSDYELSQVMMNYGALLIERGNYAKAEIFLSQALLIYRKIGMVEEEKDLWQGFADLYERSGQLQKSVNAWRRFSKMKDSLMNENVMRHQRELEAVYENEKKENEIKLNQKKIELLTQSATLNSTITIALVGGLLLLSLFLFVLFKRNQLRKQTNEQLEKQNAVIEEKNKDITDSINYARRIQDAILPPPGLMKMKFSDAFVFYRPRDIVSGDFWWTTEKDGKFIVACADCTGHGVPGGFMSVMSAAFLSEIVNEKGITQPDMILSHLRRKVISALNKLPATNSIEELSASKEGSVKDGMDIVVCTFSDSDEFEFSCANNPLWLVRDKTLISFPPDKFPVGAHHGEMKPFTNQKTKVKKGDMIYIFSDGVADQFGGEHGKKFKYKQFQDLLVSLSPLPGKEQLAGIDSTFDNWKGKLEQVDDVLVIGIRI
ncbi:MAG TPA: tetratricopeptide repeat protein [Bacteroidia bacterium]|nr:tetratricopeptide repeat protein [Bacteroidia bacterium]